MRRVMRSKRWWLAGLVMLQFGGCVTRAQFLDFLRTEIARIPADVIGQIFLIFVQSISPV